MHVQFVRSGERRYAVVVTVPGHGERQKDPAPGYDPYVPHDLVHYLVEAELGLERGLYGRLAAGGGDFVPVNQSNGKQLARDRRRQLARERSLRHLDHRENDDMARSERLTALADVHWRRSRGHRPDPSLPAPPGPEPSDRQVLDRVVARMDDVAGIWSTLPIGGSITFSWPDPAPIVDG